MDGEIEAERGVNKFIKENALQWEYPVGDFESSEAADSKLLYYFSYRDDETVEIMTKKENILCLDGHIKMNVNVGDCKCLFLKSPKDVIEAIEKFERYVQEKIMDAGMIMPKSIKNPFSVKLRRGELSPTHIFTKEEVKAEMRKADDRLGNVLVVDEDGFAHVIPYNRDNKYYPVRIDTWDARNNYVGKYSSLDDLDRAYLSALEGWLRYLKNGQRAYVNYTNLKNDSEILEEIRAYY